MEYIKKEELIIGEIYKSTLYNHIFKYLDKNGDKNPNISKIYNMFNKDLATIGHGLNKVINTTSEEKHWLNEAIRLDKFITFEEAMKTFIPEYVECIKQLIGSAYRLRKIYKVNNNGFINNNSHSFARYKYNQERFKPSTKEAYDAQFIVKEPEFVLPEKWCIKNIPEVKDFFQKYNNSVYTYQTNAYLHYPRIGFVCYFTNIQNDYIEITFDQFKKYVLKEEIVEEKGIEPLPQFKVIESIETITKVENNEGNQFFIGDVVISSNGTIQTIESFDYNKAKTNIIAFTNKQSILGNGIGIDKIEHYIEPKVEETLLEKAKRLYPIGTKFKDARGGRNLYNVTPISQFRENSDGAICIQNNGNGTIYFNNEWAEIIE